MVDNDSTTTDVGTSDDYTEQELGDAYILLNAIKSNPDLEKSWKKVLAQTQGEDIDADKKLEIIKVFIDSKGYHTTPKALLHLVKLPWWKDHVDASAPNAASDAFVQKLLVNRDLFKNWTEIVKKATDNNDFTDADKTLSALGYQCTTVQVNASFQKMRKQTLAFWSGIYGNTQGTLQAVQSKADVFKSADDALEENPDIEKDLSVDDFESPDKKTIRRIKNLIRAEINHRTPKRMPRQQMISLTSLSRPMISPLPEISS